VSGPNIPTHSVKTEVVEETEVIFPTDDETETDDVIVEKIVYETANDVKHPIVEVVCDDNLANPLNDLSFEEKPIIEEVFEHENPVSERKKPFIVEVFEHEEPFIEVFELEKPFIELFERESQFAEEVSGPETIVQEEKVEYKQFEKEIIDVSSEFEDKDLFSKDEEICDLDMEALEAEIAKRKNPQVQFNCSKCKKSFKHLKALRKHRNIHENELETYSCHFCKDGNQDIRNFKNLLSLKRHILSQHLKKPEFKCNECHEYFFTRKDLRVHKQSVHQKIMFGCETCGKSFKLK